MGRKARLLRKSYAMQRMGLAIERAISARTSKQKERAATWAAAWGLLCGIKTTALKLKDSDVEEPYRDRSEEEVSADICIPSAETETRTVTGAVSFNGQGLTVNPIPENKELICSIFRSSEVRLSENEPEVPSAAAS